MKRNAFPLQLTAPLNLTQIKKIATASQGRGGGFGGGGGRPSEGGFGSGRPAFDPASSPSPRNYNCKQKVPSPWGGLSCEKGQHHVRDDDTRG